MHIVLVGSGKTGYHFIKSILAKNEKVIVIESDAKLCKKLADELNITVIHGDGTDIDILQNAGIQSAKAIVAITGKDEDNLVACQIARINFQVRRTIAKMNEPRNLEIYHKLGVDVPLFFSNQLSNLF